MKQNFMFAIAIMFALATNAQVKSSLTKSEANPNPLKSLRSSYNVISVQDSSKQFDYNSTDEVWEAESKTNVLTRFENGNTKSQQNSDTATGTWNLKALEEFTYQNGNDLDIWLIKPWNSNILNWDDTAIYINSSGYYSNLFEEIIYEDRYIQKEWDFATNQFEDGEVYSITLRHDSLYQEFVSNIWDNTNNTWGEFKIKQIFTYDDDDNMLTMMSKEWNDSLSIWINDEQSLFAYSNNNMIQAVSQNWTNNAWSNDSKTTYAYDTNNNMTEEIEISWDNNSNTWLAQNKDTYIYDSNNNKIEYSSYNWDNVAEEWTVSRKETYTYDGNNMTHQVRYSWDDVNLEWDPYKQTVYTYNTNFDLTEKRYQRWDNASSDWNNYERYIYEYNANYDMTLDKYQNWNDSENYWENYEQTINEYNANNDITLYKYQEWNRTDSVWENDENTIYEYDTNNNLIRETDHNWNSTDSIWRNNDKTEYYWSEIDVTAINKTIQNDFRIYPNPTNGPVNIVNSKTNLRAVKVTDIIGKVIYSNESLYMKKTSINLKQFGTGLYFIEAETVNGEKLSSKIIVR